MQSRLGISTGLLGALVFFSALFGGIIPTVLVVGYILIFEENPWLRHVALKGIIMLFFFLVLKEFINIIPNLLSWISSVLSIFYFRFDYTFVSNVVTAITKAISFIQTILFLMLGLKALKNQTMSTPFVDKYIR